MELRDLPSVHELAKHLVETGLPERLRILVARETVEHARAALLDGDDADPWAEATEIGARLARTAPTPVINATGIIIHTNLGRVPMHPDAAQAMAVAGEGYGNVEVQLSSGDRGGRGSYVRLLLTELTGAEDAHVLGNNAGALYATLNVLASGGEVPVSRGELIEIGGSYRLPDLMAASGATLVEVGTTNRTRSSDYAAAVTDRTSLLLKVHPSNYEVVGFSQAASLSDLRAIADEHGLPLVHDAGSGLLDEAVPWLSGGPPAWLRAEPGIRQSVEIADLTLFSGDKLLGGPQAGIIVGRADLIAAIRAHPLSRAMRASGPTLAALAATLDLYADGRGAELPIWAMATATAEALTERSTAVAEVVGGIVEDGASMIGGGSTPGNSIPSPVVRVPNGNAGFRLLLAADPPILARRDAGDLLLDLRTVPRESDPHLVAALG